MADKVGIANQALKLCGASRITSFEDDTPEGESVRTFYDTSKRSVIAAFPWGCATRRTVQAADTVAPAWGFDNQYTLPGDFINVVEIQDLRPFEKWKVEGGKLLIDRDGPLYLSYTYDVSESDLTDDLAQALASYLGAELALDLMESSSRHDNLLQRYVMMLDQAQVNLSRNQSVPQYNPAGTFQVSRNYMTD